MTIKDMHIELNQSLQKIAANTTRKFLSEELDWVLNKMQVRFIQNVLKPKTSKELRIEDKMMTDALKNITVLNKVLTVVVEDSTRMRAILPSDYMHLKADFSYTTRECDEIGELAANTITYTTLAAPHSLLGAAPYYSTAFMTVGSDTISIPASLPFWHQYTSLKSKTEISELIAYYLYQFRALGYNIYWERADTIYMPNNFIIVGTPAVAWRTDGTSNTQTTTIAKSYQSYNTPTKSNLVPNRLTNSELVPNLLATPFYTTSTKSPVSELAGNSLYIHRDSSFTISKVAINYIRKPQRMSLALGSDCEIHEDFHQSICDKAVEYIKGRMEDGAGQQLISQDLETRIIL